MKYWMLALGLITGAATGLAQATVYKSVDAAGNVQYSDSPSKNAKAIELPPISIVPSINPLDLQTAQPATQPQRPNQYRLNFISPLADQVIRKPDGINIEVSTIPPLADGDVMTILLDGVVVSKGTAAGISTDDIDRGAHQITARVTNPTGRVVSQNSIAVNIQQGSINSPANKANQPKPTKK